MVGTDLTESISNAGEKTRLRTRLQDATKGVGRVWYLPDHVFLLSRNGHELESLRLLEPRPSGSLPLHRSQPSRFAGDTFLTKLLGGTSSSPSSTSRDSRSDVAGRLMLDVTPATVVQVLRLDDHVVLVVRSDGHVVAYRFLPEDHSWIGLITSQPTPTRIAGSVVTSISLVPRQIRPFTLYRCEREPDLEPPWNCSVIRQHFRLSATSVIFDNDVTPVLLFCPSTAISFGRGECAILWFPPPSQSLPDHTPTETLSENPATSPPGLLVRCTTSSICAVVLGGRSRKLDRFDPMSGLDFWSVCVSVLGDLGDRPPDNVLDIFETDDWLVAVTDGDVCVADRSGAILSRRHIPAISTVIGRQMIGGRHLCLIDFNRIWITDLDGSVDWVEVHLPGHSPWIGATTDADNGFLLWRDDAIHHVTRCDLAKLANVGSVSAEAAILSEWNDAYHRRIMPEFHCGLRVNDCKPPLDYSVALPLVLVHRSVDHDDVIPSNIGRADRAISFLRDNSKATHSCSAEEEHLKTLLETYCRVQRVLHPPLTNSSE